jgi:phospholipid/cholesterol/gamma-HCH transport system substrate-binding protein
VLVTVRIRADLPITQGTRARLATQGVTGLAFIALDDSGENAAPASAASRRASGWRRG